MAGCEKELPICGQVKSQRLEIPAKSLEAVLPLWSSYLKAARPMTGQAP